MNATRAHFGLPALDPELIYSYVGNGAAVLIERAMGKSATRERLADALSFFIEFYRKHALQHTRPYPGIPAAVEKLREARHTLAVLTNKPVRISTDIVAELGLSTYFSRIYGGNSFSNKKPDPIGVQTLMNEFSTRPAETMLIGDSSVDVLTARNAGIRSCGVLWGFQPESFSITPPDLTVERPEELIQLANNRH